MSLRKKSCLFGFEASGLLSKLLIFLAILRPKPLATRMLIKVRTNGEKYAHITIQAKTLHSEAACEAIFEKYAFLSSRKPHLQSQISVDEIFLGDLK